MFLFERSEIRNIPPEGSPRVGAPGGNLLIIIIYVIYKYINIYKYIIINNI